METLVLLYQFYLAQAFVTLMPPLRVLSEEVYSSCLGLVIKIYIPNNSSITQSLNHLLAQV